MTPPRRLAFAAVALLLLAWEAQLWRWHSEDRRQKVNRMPPTTSTRVSDSPDAFTLIPFDGEAPIWPLTRADTDAVFRGILCFPNSGLGACKGVNRSWPNNPTSCPRVTNESWLANPLITDAAMNLAHCLRPYFASVGASESSLDLFFKSGIVIWRAESVGPFWIADGYDYDWFGYPKVTSYLFVREGILDLPEQWGAVLYNGDSHSPALASAIQSAMSSAKMSEISNWWTAFSGASPGLVFSDYPEDLSYRMPVRVTTGWRIPFLASLKGWCDECGLPVSGLFELGASAEGSIDQVRFITLCYDLAYRQTSFRDAPAQNEFGLSDCPGKQILGDR